MNKKKITVVLSVLMLLAGGVLIYSKKNESGNNGF